MPDCSWFFYQKLNSNQLQLFAKVIWSHFGFATSDRATPGSRSCAHFSTWLRRNNDSARQNFEFRSSLCVLWETRGMMSNFEWHHFHDTFFIWTIYLGFHAAFKHAIRRPASCFLATTARETQDRLVDKSCWDQHHHRWRRLRHWHRYWNIFFFFFIP